jgi:RimJ/RimL family protein N-acetyltransferase
MSFSSRVSGVGGTAAERGSEPGSARHGVRSAPAGRLRDGTPVWVRPLVAADRSLLRAAFTRLSPRSRHSRFLRGISAAQFERMLPVLVDSVDQESHVAVVLYTETQPIGVARLLRSRSNSSVADLAVTIADDWQGLGAGTLLARDAVGRAPDVQEIHTVVSADNPASLRMLARLGPLRLDCAEGSCDVVVRLDRTQTTATAA